MTTHLPFVGSFSISLPLLLDMCTSSHLSCRLVNSPEPRPLLFLVADLCGLKAQRLARRADGKTAVVAVSPLNPRNISCKEETFYSLNIFR